MKMKVFIFLCLLLCLKTKGIAQDKIFDSMAIVFKTASDFRTNLELFSEFTTMSGLRYFDYHSGIKKPYLFNGDFAFAYTLGGEDYISGKKRSWFHAFQFLPTAKIKIFQNDPSFNDKSKPVRTPSFYPKINYFLTNQNFWNSERKFYLSLGLGHHSNGQDGTEFVDFTDTVNIYNGSFSESLIGFVSIGGVFERLLYFTKKSERNSTPSLKKNKENPIQNIKLAWKLGYEYHPVYFANQKFHQTDLYGGNRVFGNLTFINSKNQISKKIKSDAFSDIYYTKIVEKNRLNLTLEYISDLSFYSGGYNSKTKINFLDYKKRMNISLTYYRRILKSQHPALFAQIAYFGSDNYNIYFQQSQFQARIGLAFGFFEYNSRK
jgi:hypothetical protein